MALGQVFPSADNLAPWTFVLGGVTLLFAALIVWEYRSWARLKHVPGPLLHSVSIYGMNKLASGGRMAFALKELGDKYGPLVRVGPNEVMFADAETYRSVNGVRSDFIKGPWYEPSRILPDQDSLFSMRDDKLRKDLKGRMAPGYSGREGASFEPKVDQHVAQFVRLINDKYISTPAEFRPIEFSHRSQYFALDVISDLGFGKAIGFLANDEDMYHYVETNDTVFPVVAVLLNMPWLNAWLKSWPLSLAMPKEGDEAGLGRLMTFARKLVDDRLSPDAKPGNDMMQSHIRNGLNRKELMAEVFLSLIAGSDSTATAIRMTFLCLMNTPKALETLHKEIDTAVANGRVSSPIRDAEAYELPYLQAVIKEGLRMFPPSVGHNYKQVPLGGATVCGYHLPEGTQVGINILKMMRDAEVFGPDADVFRPERWLEAAERSSETYKEMAATVDLAFGHGKFQCLGKTVAYMELNKVFVELLRRFDFAVVNVQAPLKLWDAAFWVPDEFDDEALSADSDAQSSLVSLSESVLAYHEENGRLYHAKSRGNIQHELMIRTLDGKLALCPKESGANRVLDIGTGTGVWAMDYADQHPEAEVIGVDLNPMQPSFFQIDDLEKEWTFNNPFDFIMCRMMLGSFQDFPSVVKTAYENLEPNGYLELQELTITARCDDGTLEPTSYLSRWCDYILEAAANAGRPVFPTKDYHQYMRDAGFVDVVVVERRWPTNPWPRDKQFKELGLWAYADIGESLEGLSLAHFTRGLGWSQDETLAFCAHTRKDLKSRAIHAYWPM
ncbi:hypothetical protein ACHAQA_001345 [Verticillium albo-atrum]